MAANAARAVQTPDPVSDLFTPPYTTLHVGRIDGGTAHNITAKDCVFSTDIRFLPGEDADVWIERYLAHVATVEAALRKVRPEASIGVTVRSKTPGCRKEPDDAALAEQLARALTGDNGEHVVAYGTEAGQFQDAGYSAVICGPGSIEQAHQADEYLSIQQLDAGAAFIQRVIGRLAA
jgi:acetylornithine deacetylase